jgi:peptidoglycan/LPS O-acetylase OafA/YrhL
VSYAVLKEMKNSGGKLNLTLFYAHRYLRMTPSMMAVIAFSATLLQYMGEGPQWTESITMFNSWCQQNWWLNSLYLHNFINTNNMVKHFN